MKEFKNVYFIDTNIFLRVLVKENEKTFLECLNVLNLVKQGKIKAYTSNLVLAEINWVLQSFYKFSKKETLKALESIVNLKNLHIGENFDIFKALEIYKNKNVKFIDAMIATTKNEKIISYDKDFDKIGVARIEPGKI